MLGVTEQNVKTPSRMRPWGPILQRRRGTAAHWSPTRPRPRELTWGALGPGRSAHPRGSSVASLRLRLLLAGGQAAPAVCGVDRRHGENLLQKGPQRRAHGEGSAATSRCGVFSPGWGRGEGGGTATSLHPKCLSVFKRIQWAAFMGHNSENERVWKWGRELETQTRDSRELCGEQQRARSALLLGLPPVRNSNTEGPPRGAGGQRDCRTPPWGLGEPSFNCFLPSFLSFQCPLSPLFPLTNHQQISHKLKKKIADTHDCYSTSICTKANSG